MPTTVSDGESKNSVLSLKIALKECKLCYVRNRQQCL